MGRSHVKAIIQPDDTTCGPSALKIALKVIGIRKSLKTLITLCKTNRNGTSTKHMIEAINKLGLSCMVMEYTTLHHLQSALKYRSSEVRATLVSYLYDLDEKNEPHPESGHWATVASYMASKSRIVLLDSSTGKRKSYDWTDFRARWYDYDYKRRKIKRGSKKFHLIHKWQSQLMLVVARDPESLPYFRTPSARVFIP
jgi:ABC-type bacteriocin/lantibiotic exporter with double-glycine peptidase domain